ncbi:MAG: hypothetical protein PHP69_02805 [Candidatus Omnitrophica bacterium]|nr:hypothetical protein [Candidatus Omnitrophota bacterium]MDD5081096.1 hypothetical protein [Candidatus Omnitrophota bacterium]
MNINKIILLTSLATLLYTHVVYPLDWLKIHEKARSITINESLKTAASDPGSVEKLYSLAIIYLNAKQDTDAQEIFFRIIKNDPSIFQAQWGLAEILRRQKYYTDSEKILAQIIEEHPFFSPAYISLAYLKYTQADFKQVQRLAITVIKNGPARSDTDTLARAYTIYAGAKGLIASKGGPMAKIINGTQVLPNLKRAETLKPNDPEVLFGLGNFYFLAPKIAGGDITKSVEYFEKCTKKDPLLTDAYVRLAQIYKAKKDKAKYKFYINKAQSIDPENELLKDELGQVCKFNCETVKE